MNRLQKKCLLAASGFHLLLLIILVVGPGFMSSKDDLKNLQVIDVIPPNLIDAAFAGGGNPNVKPPPPAPRTQPQPPAPAPRREVKPQTVPTRTPTRPKAEVPEPTPAPKKHIVTPNLNLIHKDSQRTASKTAAKQDVNSRAQTDEKLRAFNNSITSLRDNLSPSTSVGTPGPGGEAYAGYDIFVQSIYQRRYDQELLPAGDIADRQWEVEVSVTVARNGNVLSSRVTNSSGNPALNKLVQRVLDKVTFIAPFPKASKDQQRTFTIIFDLKPKKAIG